MKEMKQHVFCYRYTLQTVITIGEKQKKTEVLFGDFLGGFDKLSAEGSLLASHLQSEILQTRNSTDTFFFSSSQL